MTDARKPADYKSGVKPIWCPGCGDFGVLAAITRALAHLRIAPHEAAVISGIGCAGRIPAYVRAYGFHGLHGRALPIATGLKLARPDLTVLAAGGDGDIYSIGGNHFLHACRRNADITLLVMDNRIYGMTKGQPSPTTEDDFPTRLYPHGAHLPPINALGIALSAGANFVARGFSGDPDGLAKMIARAIGHPGFSVLEILSPCVTFRPEQKLWKRQVARDALKPAATPGEALRLAAEAPPLTAGVLWEGDRAPWSGPDARAGKNMEELLEVFRA